MLTMVCLLACMASICLLLCCCNREVKFHIDIASQSLCVDKGSFYNLSIDNDSVSSDGKLYRCSMSLYWTDSTKSPPKTIYIKRIIPNGYSVRRNGIKSCEKAIRLKGDSVYTITANGIAAIGSSIKVWTNHQGEVIKTYQMPTLLNGDIDTTVFIRAHEETYFLVQLLNEFIEDGGHIKSLHVEKNEKTIANIKFPSSEEVKNFSVNIKERRNGFRLECFYGGGNNLYNRRLYFKCANDNLYLDKIVATRTMPNSNRIIKEETDIQPRIDIRNLDILNYIENTP